MEPPDAALWRNYQTTMAPTTLFPEQQQQQQQQQQQTGAQYAPDASSGPSHGTDQRGTQADPAQTTTTGPQWRPSWIPPSNAGGLTPNQTFTGLGAADAQKSVTGITASFLLTQTSRNIEDRQARVQPYGGKQFSQEFKEHQGKRESLSWDGKDPGITLRVWLKAKLLWQIRTPTPPEQWGIALLEALPQGTLARALADTVPDLELMSIDGYIKIMQKILVAHQAYLEAELEKAVLDFMYPRSMEKQELYTTYAAYLELLGRELDQQFAPQPPLDERIKAIVLLRHCHLNQEQKLQLALKKGWGPTVPGCGRTAADPGPPRGVLTTSSSSTACQ